MDRPLQRGFRNRNSQNSGIAGIGGWGVWPLPGFLWRICPHALRALKGDHSSPKSDNFPTKVFLFPQNNIYLTFSLSKWFTHFCRKLSWVAFTRYYGPNRSGCNACILGLAGPVIPPLMKIQFNINSIFIGKKQNILDLPPFCQYQIPSLNISSCYKKP